MALDIRLLGCAAGAAAVLMLAGSAAQAQFFPSLQPQAQQPQRAPQPAPQKAQPPARKAQPKAAAPQAPAVPTPYGEVRTACSTELRSTCAGVPPGSADSVLCLRRNFAVHSPPCQAALTRAGVPTVQQPAAAAPAQPTPPAGSSDGPRRISTDRVDPATTAPEPVKDLKIPAMRATQEARFVARNCKEDHSLLCQGVTFGQGRVLRCLASHQSSLTNECRRALTRMR